jgi:hypothetical protein
MYGKLGHGNENGHLDAETWKFCGLVSQIACIADIILAVNEPEAKPYTWCVRAGCRYYFCVRCIDRLVVLFDLQIADIL